MARPALRNIDPNLDLSRHLLTLDQLPASWDQTGLFARIAPLEVEVGSGKGMFMVTASGERPQHNFLGCEIAQKYARLAAARLARAGRGNAAMLTATRCSCSASVCRMPVPLPSTSIFRIPGGNSDIANAA